MLNVVNVVERNSVVRISLQFSLDVSDLIEMEQRGSNLASNQPGRVKLTEMELLGSNLAEPAQTRQT